MLQAADVLAYRADEVPVGEDQREHLELMRDVARRFNVRFGERRGGVGRARAPHPRGGRADHGPAGPDAQDVDHEWLSEQGTVYVLDEPAAILKKCKSAVTDSGREIERSPEKPGVSNLIEILAVARERHPRQVEADMRDARGYGDLKVAVAEAVIE